MEDSLAHAQASNVLNEMYCNKLQFQLQHAEEKKAKGKGKGKLVGDGLPLLLSGDEFYEKVVVFTQWQQEEATKKAVREHEKAELAGPIAEWKKQELARKAENEAKRQRYHAALVKWEEAKEAAKLQKKCCPVTNPKMEKLSSAIPKPKVTKLQVQDSDKSKEFDKPLDSDSGSDF
jgi:hypothetical protein